MFATRRNLYGMVTAAALSLLLVGPALAADDTTATVTGGSLSITEPLVADFAGRNITGAAQTTTAALATFEVSDLRGTGAGWHVTAQATQFTGASKSLATGSLSLADLTATPDGTSSTSPTSVGPWTIDNGAVSVASAALNAGMGKYDFATAEMTLSLPADVYADAYASTVTISVVTAP